MFGLLRLCCYRSTCGCAALVQLAAAVGGSCDLGLHPCLCGASVHRKTITMIKLLLLLLYIIIIIIIGGQGDSGRPHGQPAKSRGGDMAGRGVCGVGVVVVVVGVAAGGQGDVGAGPLRPRQLARGHGPAGRRRDAAAGVRGRAVRGVHPRQVPRDCQLARPRPVFF